MKHFFREVLVDNSENMLQIKMKHNGKLTHEDINKLCSDFNVDKSHVWLLPDSEIKTKMKSVMVSLAGYLESHLNYRQLTARSLSRVETAFYESKPREIIKMYCTEYSTMEASERKMVWHTYIKRATLEIIEAGRF